MIRKMKVDYDSENDSLFIYDPKLKSKASVEINDLIIDYSAKKDISAFELLNASKFFSDLSQKDSVLTKDRLRKILECKVDIIPRNNFFMIKFIFVLRSKEQVVAPIMVPTINEPSPAAIV
ncbi:MAG: DUF2283 domain-containing protein [archaeon]